MEDNRGEKRRKTRRRRIVGKRVDARRSMVDLDEDETVERERGRKEGRKEALKRARAYALKGPLAGLKQTRIEVLSQDAEGDACLRVSPLFSSSFPLLSLPLPSAIPTRHYARILNAEYYEILSRNLPPGRSADRPPVSKPLPSFSSCPPRAPDPPYEISTINARPLRGPS